MKTKIGSERRTEKSGKATQQSEATRASISFPIVGIAASARLAGITKLAQ